MVNLPWEKEVMHPFPDVKSPFTKGRWVTAINDYTFWNVMSVM